MNLSKKLFLSFVLLCTSIFLFAQSLTLNSVCNSLSKNAVTKGNFTQTKMVNIAKSSREFKSTGNFLFCEKGIVWNTEKPFPSTMIISPTKISQTNPGGETTIISSGNNLTLGLISSTLTGIFSGDISSLEKNFNIEFSADENSAANSWKLNLFPKDENFSKAIDSIFISGNFKGNVAELENIILTEKNKNTIKYILENQTVAKELSEDEEKLF